MVLPPLLMSVDTRVVVFLTSVLQKQPKSQMPPHAYDNYVMGPLQVGFSFRVEPLTDLLICVGVCYGASSLLSGAMMDAILTYGGSTIGVCTTEAFWIMPMAGICASW